MATKAIASSDEPIGHARKTKAGGINTHSRRAEVLNAAVRVFFRKGYRAATIQDIGAELDFTGAALYYYVGGRKDLLAAIVMEPHRRLVEIAERLLATDIPPTERLRRIIIEHVTLMLGEREMFGVMFRERVELTPKLAEKLGELEDRYYLLVRKILTDTVEAKAIVVENAGVATLGLIGMINWTTRWYRKDGPRSPEQIGQQYFDLFYLGVAPRARL